MTKTMTKTEVIAFLIAKFPRCAFSDFDCRMWRDEDERLNQEWVAQVEDLASGSTGWICIDSHWPEGARINWD